MVNRISAANNQQRVRYNWNRAGENALFPKFSQATNDFAREILQANKEETTGYDLLDDKTGMPSSKMEDWEKAYMDESVFLSSHPDEKPVIWRDITEGGEMGMYWYDSNNNGHSDVSTFFNYGKLESIHIDDETETASYRSLWYDDMYGSAISLFGNGGSLYEEEVSENENRLKILNIHKDKATLDTFNLFFKDENKIKKEKNIFLNNSVFNYVN